MLHVLLKMCLTDSSGPERTVPNLCAYVLCNQGTLGALVFLATLEQKLATTFLWAGGCKTLPSPFSQLTFGFKGR